MSKKIIIGISGASGASISISLLQALASFPEWESYLCITPAGEKNIQLESSYSLKEVQALAHHYIPIHDMSACIASGSFKTAGMIVAPCSMKSLAGIANGYSDSILLRAADVCLKERRPLVLVARESPLSEIHLSNMLRLSRMGAIILPPMLQMYLQPKSIEEMIQQFTDKILSYFGLEINPDFQWKGK